MIHVISLHFYISMSVRTRKTPGCRYGQGSIQVKEEFTAVTPINTKMYSHGCLTASTYV